MITINDVIKSWNDQADEHNKWHELDADERVEWAITHAQLAGLVNESLIDRAVRSARPMKYGRHPRWIGVMGVFACGSTRASELCRAHGIDPEELVGGMPDAMAR